MIKKFLADEAVGFLVRVGLGVIFIFASVDKIINPDAFAEIVNNYQILPGDLVNIFALILPMLELLCGLALILGVMVRAAAVWTGGMLVLFIVAVSLALSNGINISCGCFSTSAHARSLGFNLIWQDFGMLLIAIHAVYFDNRFLSVSRLFKSRRNK
ncbi:MauE/DoxX family redox-associated membrane protein [Candidatus Zixiibacteriota bacterium]